MASKMLKLKAVAQEQQHRGAGKEEEEEDYELKLHTFNQAGIAVDDGTVSAELKLAVSLHSMWSGEHLKNSLFR